MQLVNEGIRDGNSLIFFRHITKNRKERVRAYTFLPTEKYESQILYYIEHGKSLLNSILLLCIEILTMAISIILIQEYFSQWRNNNPRTTQSIVQ